MALIEVFHVVAGQFPVDATNATDIPQGSIVTLDATGNVALSTAHSASQLALGISGDSRSQGTTGYTPESGGVNTNAEPPTDNAGALVLGAYGDQFRYTQNRVADNFNEVLASGKMTVYHSGGEFWTDQYVTTDTFVPSNLVGSDATGNFTNTAAPTTIGRVAGMVLTAPTGYPSGVPGTGPNAVGFQALPEGGNSISWGTFLHVKLMV